MDPSFATAIVPGGGGGDDPVDELPAVRREPAIQIASDFKTKQQCKDAVTILDFGQFMIASWLIEQMSCNSRFRAVNNTRFDGLVGTEIRWEPGRKNATARRAARDIVTDWPLIASSATRKQLHKWGINLGVGFAQKHWYESASSRRYIPRVETYHPQWAMWDWSLRAYKIWTIDGWAIVPSPSLMVPGQPWQPPYSSMTKGMEADTLRRWVVHEPFGQHSWREGLVHAAWESWFGHACANRDMSRSSEKHGVGLMKVEYPKSTDTKALNKLTNALQKLGTEAVIPVEVYPDNNDDGLKSYNVTPFEWQATGYNIISGTKESNAADLAVLYLGHNTTAETKGASVGASAQVGNLIRGDIRIGDTLLEFGTYYPQVLRDWTEVNYGDPADAPVPIYVTEAPSENQAGAQTLLWLTQALEQLRKSAPGVDFDELLNRFRVPLGDAGAKVVIDLAANTTQTSGDGDKPPAAAKEEPDDADPASAA